MERKIKAREFEWLIERFVRVDLYDQESMYLPDIEIESIFAWK